MSSSSRGSPKVVALGAEAAIVRYEFLGMPSIFKVRLPKAYRDPELDEEVRSRRTLQEARVMRAAREAGARVPRVLLVLPRRALIVMEYVSGERFKEAEPKMGDKEACEVMRAVGEYVARMHLAGIVHGDLTTSNVILTDEGPYLVDFGLAKFSNDPEDRGVDAHLMLRALESTHYARASKLFECFMSGYSSVAGEEKAREVMDKVREIRMRGRYIEERRRKAGGRHE